MSKTKHFHLENQEGRWPFCWSEDEIAEMRRNQAINDAWQKWEHEHPNHHRVTHDIESTGNNHK